MDTSLHGNTSPLCFSHFNTMLDIKAMLWYFSIFTNLEVFPVYGMEAGNFSGFRNETWKLFQFMEWKLEFFRVTEWNSDIFPVYEIKTWIFQVCFGIPEQGFGNFRFPFRKPEKIPGYVIFWEIQTFAKKSWQKIANYTFLKSAWQNTMPFQIWKSIWVFEIGLKIKKNRE